MLPFDLSTVNQAVILRFFKTNALYLISLIVFIGLAAYFIPLQIASYVQLRSDVALLEGEVIELRERREAIIAYNTTNLDEALLLLNTLLPNVEDRFSIYPVIDNLQELTGMFFENTASPFSSGGASEGVIAISVQATTSEPQVRTLLENYHYKAGRLLTLNGLTFTRDRVDPSLLVANFDILFHSKNADVQNAVLSETNEEALAFVQELKNYFESRGAAFSTIRLEEEDIPVDYGTKQNPFAE